MRYWWVAAMMVAMAACGGLRAEDDGYSPGGPGPPPIDAGASDSDAAE